MPNTHVPAAATGLPDARDLGDLHELIVRAINLTELMYLAGEGLVSVDRDIASAFTAGADMIDKVLKDGVTVLEANMNQIDGGDE